MNHFEPLFKGISTRNRILILIGLGILLVHLLACGVIAILGGNVADVIRAHLGM